MATEAQVAANRRNAAKSTGPRTEAGRAASRLNATRHGLAGSVDPVVGADEAARVEARAVALIRELGAVGEAGTALARRAAVLSLRMEAAARRELVVVARDRAEAIAAFDRERAERVDALVARAVRADSSVAPEVLVEQQRVALRALDDLPDGIVPLVELWEQLARTVQHADPTLAKTASDVARGWLGLAPATTAHWSARRWLERIHVELARLRGREAALEAERLAVARLRDQAGDLATFDPSPAACLARRYDLAAQNGFFRTLKALRDLPRATDAASPTPVQPAPTPRPVVANPPPAPAPAPVPTPAPAPHPAAATSAPASSSAGLGSFRPALPVASAPATPALPLDPAGRLDHRKRRPDPRQLVRNHR